MDAHNQVHQILLANISKKIWKILLKRIGLQ